MSAVSWRIKLSMCFLVIGNLIGAGILVMPIQIGIAGLLPALIGILIIGIVMMLNGLTLAGEAINKKDEIFNYPSLYGSYLGNTGKWLAIAANILILYGMMVAYLCGGAAVISALFGSTQYEVHALVIFYMIMAGLVLCNKRIAHFFSGFFVIAMWIAFVVIIVISAEYIQTVRYQRCDWSYFPFIFPVLVTAFWFHNIIPNVCHNLKWNRKAIIEVISAALVIGMLMYVIWTLVTIGAIPLDDGSANSLIYAYKNELPATVQMGKISGSRLIRVAAPVFALLAIATSYIATALGTMSFNRDLARQFANHTDPRLIVLVSLLPSFLISLLFPGILIKAVDLVGGIGIALLFGSLPALISIIRAIKEKHPVRKIIYIIIFIGFSLLLIWQFMVEFGFIKPNI